MNYNNIEEKLEKILFAFKKEQDYAERKNQIILGVISLLIGFFTITFNKIQFNLIYLCFAFLFLSLFFVLWSLIPQKEKIFFIWNKKSKKIYNPNIYNYLDWTRVKKDIKKIIHFFRPFFENSGITYSNSCLIDQIWIAANITKSKSQKSLISIFFISLFIIFYLIGIII